MGGINFNNFNSVVRTLDTNKNGSLEELKVPDQIKSRLDANKDLKVNPKELAAAMKADIVQVKDGEITYSKGLRPNNFELEKLKKINDATKSASQWMFPTDYSDEVGQKKIDHLNKDNVKFEKSIKEMEGALRDIDDMTSGKEDGITKSINSVAKTALEQSGNLKLDSFVNKSASKNPDGSTDVNALNKANIDLRSSYTFLNSALETIKKSTDELPNLNKTATDVDKKITKAFSNISEIKNSPRSASEVKDHLYKVGEANDLHVTGRAKPYSGGGASIGAVAGGAAAFYLGKNLKAVSIGIAAGSALGAGFGALTGKLIDDKFKNKANELRKLANDISNYKPDADEKSLDDSATQVYKELVGVDDNRDLDTALKANNTMKSVKVNVAEIENKTSRLAEGYKIANKK